MSEKQRLIKKVVEESPIPITPLGISQQTGMKHATVKKYVRDLERQGIIRRQLYGYYVPIQNPVTLESSGVGGEGGDGGLVPRGHGLTLRVAGGISLGALRRELDFEVVRATLEISARPSLWVCAQIYM